MIRVKCLEAIYSHLTAPAVLTVPVFDQPQIIPGLISPEVDILE